MNTKSMTKAAVYQRKRMKHFRQLGLCVSCGKVEVSGRNTCPTCAQKVLERQKKSLRRLRPHWKKLGICTICGQRQAITGRSWCGVCAERHTEHVSQKREERRKAGLCTRCGNPSVLGRVMCLECAAKSREKWHRHKAKKRAPLEQAGQEVTLAGRRSPSTDKVHHG